MAFQQPVARPVRRAATPPPITTTPASQKPEPIEQSQEWVLFSPDPITSAHARADSLQTPRTTGARSRLSDFSSLDTAANSQRENEANYVNADYDEDETEDLDSLDDGLHAFQELTPHQSNSAQAVDQSVEAVLPTHDGLGTFPGNSSPVQEQFWQHEKYNPRRRRQSLKRSSLQRRFEALDNEQPTTATEERNQRIEKWRTEQSLAIMEEIERESRRRRRKSRLSVASVQGEHSPQHVLLDETPSRAATPRPSSSHSPETESQPESFWARFTRRVIRDFIGIDDATLSYIFGEALPVTAKPQEPPPNAAELIDTAERALANESQLVRASESWEDRLLARVSKELGILVNQISEHPGAFSTYLRTQEPAPYAGLPTPAEFAPPRPSAVDRSTTSVNRQRQGSTVSHHPPSSPYFAPTLKHRRRTSAAATDPSLWGIDEEGDEDKAEASAAQQHEYTQLQRDRDYWEKDLDVKMVFGYLRNRLARTPPAGQPSSSAPGRPSSTTSPADSLRRAALIRHHHPLVGQSMARSQTSPYVAAPLSPVLGRRHSGLMEDDVVSSCASQSTKKSKTHHSGSISLSSSRNYWDIGGPAAGWGEV